MLLLLVTSEALCKGTVLRINWAFLEFCSTILYGMQAMKDMANTAKANDEYTGPDSKDFPHTVPANNK